MVKVSEQNIGKKVVNTNTNLVGTIIRIAYNSGKMSTECVLRDYYVVKVTNEDGSTNEAYWDINSSERKWSNLFKFVD